LATQQSAISHRPEAQREESRHEWMSQAKSHCTVKPYALCTAQRRVKQLKAVRTQFLSRCDKDVQALALGFCENEELCTLVRFVRGNREAI
jgi:hypothetical protein